MYIKVISQTEPYIHHIRVSVSDWQLGTSITFRILFETIKDLQVRDSSLVVDGQEYEVWSQDDTYMESLILWKLNLTKIEEIDE